MFRSALVFVLCGLLLVALAEHSHSHDHDHIDEPEADVSQVTCGSVIKLRNIKHNTRLHSHSITYGSGSGQQSVTGFPNINDANSLWLIKGEFGKPCSTGTAIKNGDVIRLLHLQTGKALHSHLHRSPLSGNQEVSAYGDNGGDTGDNWKVVVTKDSTWMRSSKIRLQHADTGLNLMNTHHKFGSPIPGQMEIVCSSSNNNEASWMTEEGFYFPVEKK
ncbi:hypothetical protein PROFUN_02954 [Planoprotostelium fungivorum]|uniref:MIR domain-containing protein n=1 Tax=Planoprotostelium fungivorum TaxID=1890364 RepID=A0A2P6NX57_9EUKA|nr:hypothetical protein PROFUN_02954 [Planoprotostelium fungivorum]